MFSILISRNVVIPLTWIKTRERYVLNIFSRSPIDRTESEKRFSSMKIIRRTHRCYKVKDTKYIAKLYKDSIGINFTAFALGL